MAALADGFDTLVAICKALGLDERNVARLVIVCDIDELPTVYVKEHLGQSQARNLAENLVVMRQAVSVQPVSDVVVDDNGNVFVEDKGA
jgi:hypothetical protein